MVLIKGYEKKYYEDVRFACLNCDGPCDSDEQESKYLLKNYCDYYIEVEPNNCFVAVNENDRAVGYIISAEDYWCFEREFNKIYIPRIKEIDETKVNEALNSAHLQKKYAKNYPAHLHIGILPEYQRLGLGSKLINTLLEHYKQKVPGIMLGCWSDNTLAIKLYKKFGFEILGEESGSTAMGKKLS